MSRRRQPKPSPEDTQDAHREILEHLEQNPPPKPTTKKSAASPSKGQKSKAKPKREAEPSAPRSTAMPTLMLRQLRLQVAEDRLLHFLRVQQRAGTTEVLVIVGRGRHSPGGEPVLGPAIRDLCNQRKSLVESWSEAPANLGGAGAIVVQLRRVEG